MEGVPELEISLYSSASDFPSLLGESDRGDGTGMLAENLEAVLKVLNMSYYMLWLPPPL